MSEILYVKMLGEVSLERNGSRIDDSSNRMRKVWLLLAYLIYSRSSRLTQEHFLNLLQGAGNEEAADPSGRLKAMLYRVRTMLNQLDDSAGHDWIIRKSGTYAWNTEIPIQVDVDEFERLYNAARITEDEEERLDFCLQALALYRGDFCAKLSMEPWVMPIAAYYHRLYLDLAEQALVLLETRERWGEAATLSEKALKHEPYSEELYQHLMRNRIAAGDRTGAAVAFEEMRELLYSTFGVMPSDKSRQLYRDATQETGAATFSVGTVVEQLREAPGTKGALYCEYDFFKTLYQVQARTIIRSGEIFHIALFSVHGQRRKELPRRSLDRVMENLKELIMHNLRQGDVFTQCSVSQFVVMLQLANYENSCMVCQRIVRTFARQFPHSPAEIHFSVQPLEPLAAQPEPEGAAT